MTSLWYIGIISCLFIVAFMAAILGVGGGSLYTPTQIFFGVNIHEAAATSLFLTIVLSIGATFVYHRARKVDWRMAAILIAFMMAGGFAGGYLTKFISEFTLTIVLITTLLISGAVMTIRERRSSCITAGEKKAWYIWRRRLNGEIYSLNVIIAFPVSLAAGVASGLVGIGGGIITVPMMTMLFGVPVDIAIATSGFMVGITAIGGLGGHLMVDHVNLVKCSMLAPGVFFGSMLGARFMLGLDKLYLKRIFGIAMFIIAAGVLIKTLKGM